MKTDKKRTRSPRQKKHLGQVFLRSDRIPDIVASRLEVSGIKKVLEIGPGDGILTAAMLARGIEVTAIEVDERFATALPSAVEKKGQSTAMLTVQCQDILETDLDGWGENFDAVVGNIPYYISSPILMKVLGTAQPKRPIVFMAQKEFAQRVVASPGSKVYGSLSVYVQLRAQVESWVEVPRSEFRPVPKVDSEVFSLVRKEALPPQDILDLSEKLCRSAFQMRRKTLRNSWKDFPGIEDCAVDLSLRPEVLSPDEFLRIASALSQQIVGVDVD